MGCNPIFETLAREAQQRDLASRLEAEFSAAAHMAKWILKENLLAPAELEHRLRDCVGTGFATFTNGLIDQVSDGIDRKLLALGLPDSAADPCSVSIHDNAVDFTLGWCEQSHPISLRHCSEKTRDGVLNQLKCLGLPIVWAHELYEFSWGIQDAIPKTFPDTEALDDDFMEASWKRAIDICEVDEYEDDSGPQTGLIGIGGRHEFERLLRLYHGAKREYDLPGIFDPNADALWIKRLKVLRKVKKALPKGSFRRLLVSTEARPAEEGWVLCAGDKSLDLIGHYFNFSNDGSGELPGGQIDAVAAGGIGNALTWLKAIRGVLNLMDDGV